MDTEFAMRVTGAMHHLHRFGRHAFIVAVAAYIVLSAQQSAQAANGGVITLPLPGVKNRSGLRLDIDSRWVSGSGYRPVRIRVSTQPFGPAIADRTLEVQLRARGYYNGARAGAVKATVELSQGATFGEAIVSVPQTTYWNALDVETREDGWKHRDLSGKNMGMATRYYSTFPDNSPSIVVAHWSVADRTAMLLGGPTSTLELPKNKVKTVYLEPFPVVVMSGATWMPLILPRVEPTVLSTVILPNGGALPGFSSSMVHVNSLPDIRALAGRFPEVRSNVYGVNAVDVFSTVTAATDADLERLVADLPNVDFLAPNLLPDRWLDYTNIDVLIISRGDLRLVKEQFPEKVTALRTWLATGATLCVYDTGTDFERLDEIEQLLSVEPLPTSGEIYRGWDQPHGKDFKDTVSATQQVNAVWMQQQAVTQPGTSRTPPETPKTPTFVYRPLGQGRLVSFAPENPFPGNDYEWNWLFNSIPIRNWLAPQRYGVSQFQENMQFWNFLVEGIGKAPVKSFLALITVFAIVIGPVNYYALQRRGRLYLLLVTVPAGAILIAGGLFLFAMFGDGFGTRVRLRSYTELDQKGGRALSWSRQTYYAGFAPSRGLSFPAEAAVMPVEHRPLSNSGLEDTRRELVWGDKQNLVAGYFYSRTMAQFVIVEPQSTSAAVRVIESPDGSSPNVINELGTSIEWLVLSDSKGEWFHVKDLPAGGRGATKAWDKETDAEQWVSRYRASRPKFPDGFNANSLDDVSQFFSGRRWPTNSGLTPTFETSILEMGIREAFDDDSRSLSPRSFIAIVPQSPFVSLGVESIRTQSGFHVVHGRW